MLSIVIPLYNKEKQIGDTLRSVLAQTYQDFEIVIVDDGSTDNSGAEVKKFTDPRIRLINQKNAGVAAARNQGIEEAKGEYVGLLDADDEWKPKFLETISNLIEKYPQCDVFACNYEFRDVDGIITHTIIRNLPFSSEDGVISNYFEVAANSNPPISSSSVVVSKKAFQSIDGFPTGIKSGEDLLTWARLAVKYQIAYSRISLAIFNNGGADNRGMNDDQRNRRPEIVDYVGAQLKQLLKENLQIVGLRKYVSLWHKMRCRIFINKGEQSQAIKEAFIALRYNINKKNIIFLVLAFLPSSFSDKIIQKFS